MAKTLPKEVLAALERIELQFRQAFIDAFERIADSMEVNRIASLIEAGQIDAAVGALNIDPSVLAALHEAERSALVAGGQLVLSGLRLRDPYVGNRFILGFDGRAVRAEAWAGQQSSRLITEVIEDQRRMAREVIQTGIEVGKTPRAVALEISGRMNSATGRREGGFIGLTSQQARWAMNAERQLRDLDPGYFSRTLRDKRSDGVVARAISEGKPLAEADIRRLVNRYKDRLLKMRADTIARTEALNALRAGRHEGFQQLIDSGKVRADQVTVTWSATMDGRTRDTHRAMNGQAVKMGQLFTSPSGAQFEYPGDVTHGAPGDEVIQCRCLAEYRIKSDLMR